MTPQEPRTKNKLSPRAERKTEHHIRNKWYRDQKNTKGQQNFELAFCKNKINKPLTRLKKKREQ